MDDDFDGQDVIVPSSPKATQNGDSSTAEKPATIPDSLTMSKRKRKREKDKERKAKRLKEESESKAAAVAATREAEGKPTLGEGGKGKKKNKNGKEGGKKFEEKELVEDAVNPDIAMLDTSLMADYLIARLRKFHKDLSAIELEDRTLPSSAFLDTSSTTSEPRLLKHLADFMGKVTPGGDEELKKASEEKGAPHTIVVSGSAVRCTHVKRALGRFQTKESLIGKCFAKHLKMSESVEFLNGNRTGIVVGTPKRILDLIKEGALKLTDLKRLVIDASRIDAKGMGIFDLRETQGDLIELLNHDELKKKLVNDGDNGTAQVIFY